MVELKIEGMSCGHCAEAVRKALAAVHGVREVTEVSVEQGSARIEGDADPKLLIAAVEEEGYKAWEK